MGVMFWSRIRARHAQVTTLNPAVRRGNLLILKYDEDPLVGEKYRQSQRRKTRASTAIRLVNEDDSELLLEVGTGSGMQHDIKTLQEDVAWMTRKPSERRYYM